MTILAGGAWHGELHNRKKSGELFWELVSISAVKDLDGQLISFLAVKEDITERKQAENAIRELNTDLEQRVAEPDCRTQSPPGTHRSDPQQQQRRHHAVPHERDD